eukprot:scaffold249338_cov36-Tisochrysis_lutea.AAC.4
MKCAARPAAPMPMPDRCVRAKRCSATIVLILCALAALACRNIYGGAAAAAPPKYEIRARAEKISFGPCRLYRS